MIFSLPPPVEVNYHYSREETCNYPTKIYYVILSSTSPEPIQINYKCKNMTESKSNYKSKRKTRLHIKLPIQRRIYESDNNEVKMKKEITKAKTDNPLCLTEEKSSISVAEPESLGSFNHMGEIKRSHTYQSRCLSLLYMVLLLHQCALSLNMNFDKNESTATQHTTCIIGKHIDEQAMKIFERIVMWSTLSSEVIYPKSVRFKTSPKYHVQINEGFVTLLQNSIQNSEVDQLLTREK